MLEHNDWSQRRRARHHSRTASDTALALCARHLQSGALARASRAALLAQRLMHLETKQSERLGKQAIKAAAERQRAEAALEQARKAVALLNPPSVQHAEYNVLCSDEDWPETLKRMLADATAQRHADNAEIGSQPVQNAPPDSC